MMTREGGVRPLSVDDVYQAGERHRWIVALFKGRVFYDTGADLNRDCLEKTMRRWIRRRSAKLIHARDRR